MLNEDFYGLNKNNILAIWSFRNDLPLKQITKEELSYTNLMPDTRAHQYIHSRGYVRYALSQIFNEDPLDSGWLYKIIIKNKDELKNLMSEEEYKKLIGV